jgi:hypothetical protein
MTRRREREIRNAALDEWNCGCEDCNMQREAFKRIILELKEPANAPKKGNGTKREDAC